MSKDHSGGTMIKGASLGGRLDYVENTLGADGWRRVMGKLPVSDQAALEKGVLPSSFFPLDLCSRIDEEIARLVNPRNPVAVYREIGRASAEKNLNAFHSVFVKGRDPHFVLAKFPAVRATYYSDGIARYEKTGTNEGRLEISGAKGHSTADCESTAGYFERAIEILGGKKVTVRLSKCRDRGDELCELSCSWR